MSGFRDYAIMLLCALLIVHLILASSFPESYGTWAAKIGKAYQTEMAEQN